MRPGGYIDVEVTDADDEILPGFDRASCRRFTGDSLQHIMRWQGGMSEGIIPGGRLRLRIYMKNASLYSFTFGR